MTYRLKTLSLSGFKSFAKTTALDFSVPVTAIVGPNGSGKSNVVEAMRFVLGEQSLKSMRGSSGSDMIFGGSRSVSKMNRASVAITFDNHDRIFQLSGDIGEQDISLDFDEIVLKREVFSDGTNVYSINDSQVRLKDIQDLVSRVHVGASGHHIISQGEADRILHASPRDRRMMIEEALGLRIHRIKIKDAERKLEKTKTHMQEVEALRRELAPHIRFLKKQVEKVEQTALLRKEYKSQFGVYASRAHAWHNASSTQAQQKYHAIASQRKELEESMARAKTSVDESPLRALEQQLHTCDEQRRAYTAERDILARSLGRIDALLDVAQSIPERPVQKKPDDIVLPQDETIAWCDTVLSLCSVAPDADNQTLFDVLESLRQQVSLFKEKIQTNTATPEDITPARVVHDIGSLQQEKKDIEQKIKDSENKIQELDTRQQVIRDEITRFHEEGRKKEHVFYELATQVHTLKSKEESLRFHIDAHQRFVGRLSDDEEEARVLVGYDPVAQGVVDISEYKHDTEDTLGKTRHELERIKIRIEDAGGGSGDDIIKEYNETMERDQFLEKELADLWGSIVSLEELIASLVKRIEHDFAVGVKKINDHFSELVSVMFGGGSGSLTLTDISKRKTMKTEDGEIVDVVDQEEVEKEIGVVLKVSLPRKNIKSLDMLSGGERSLVSIAALFALSQVNPPPFLVLDETDAALDEANSRRYGDMLERLSTVSQLVVVTHNRETMSRANILYGVTMSNDGVSQLLSVKFDEAVAVAK
jgi:chromosome segregation ATPase